MTVGMSSAEAARAKLAGALVRTASGDHQAFTQVYTMTSAKLYGICRQICHERTAAEDVLAEVYLTVWRQAAAWEAGRASPITWLATIARHRAIDWRREQDARARLPAGEVFDLCDPSPNAESGLLLAETSANLRRCVASLEPDQRDAIQTVFFEDITYSELAERQRIPLGTMKSRIRRGLMRLKAELEN